jgi:hypothetical protein
MNTPNFEASQEIHAWLGIGSFSSVNYSDSPTRYCRSRNTAFWLVPNADAARLSGIVASGYYATRRCIQFDRRRSTTGSGYSANIDLPDSSAL